MKLIVSTILLLGSIEAAYAREWRGIVPLRSTRSDVVRLFNQCSDQVEACRFTLENENVHILFSGGLPSHHSDCATRLPPEAVMFIAVEPRMKLKRLDRKLPSQPKSNTRLVCVQLVQLWLRFCRTNVRRSGVPGGSEARRHVRDC